MHSTVVREEGRGKKRWAGIPAAALGQDESDFGAVLALCRCWLPACHPATQRHPIMAHLVVLKQDLLIVADGLDEEVLVVAVELLALQRGRAGEK